MEKTTPRIALPANPLCEMLHDDCLAAMRDFPDASIDLICADLPYNVTNLVWDKPMDLAALWAEFRRLIKPRGVIVCHAVQPFTHDLISAARDLFRYSLVWHKLATAQHFHCNKRPICHHEDVLIFAPGRLGTMTYNAPGATTDKLRRIRQTNPRSVNKDTGTRAGKLYMSTKNHPDSILRYPNPPGKSFHPTAKPESLMEFIVAAYSNPGDVVLDPTMGSGTTGVACVRHDRQFIGIERDETYFVHAYHRIHAEHSNPQKSAA